MARKVSTQAAQAFAADKNFKQGATAVYVSNGFTHLELHGHLIARKGKKGIEITNAGYFTNVTKERLNALPGVYIQQKGGKGKWYLNGERWDGQWIKIKQ